jgi:hypothetical protein
MNDDTHEPINKRTFPHGIRCGCACGCPRELNDGNAMTQEVQQPPPVEAKLPWESRDDDATGNTPIRVSVCVSCYVGNHINPVSQ